VQWALFIFFSNEGFTMRDTSVNNGLFIAIEGFDGSGKTTFIKALKTALEAEMSKPDYQGTRKHVATSKEPAGVYRDLLINSFKPDSSEDSIDRMLLAALSRNKSWSTVIYPSLMQNHIVLTDRWELSTLVTNGLWENDKGITWRANGEASFYALREAVHHENIEPDIYICLDTPFDVCMQRLKDRKDGNAFDENVKNESQLRSLHYEFHHVFTDPSSEDLMYDFTINEDIFVIKDTTDYFNTRQGKDLVKAILSYNP
jgi:thymidylate kinase